jgi:hypothetical protein
MQFKQAFGFCYWFSSYQPIQTYQRKNPLRR